jgi:hypothetical protein
LSASNDYFFDNDFILTPLEISETEFTRISAAASLSRSVRPDVCGRKIAQNVPSKYRPKWRPAKYEQYSHRKCAENNVGKHFEKSGLHLLYEGEFWTVF